MSAREGSFFEILDFKTDELLAGAVADRFAERLRESRSQYQKPFSVALSGGRIAQRFFESVAAVTETRRPAVDRLHLFWADERCVPPDHPDSNFRLAMNLWIRHAGVPAANVHRIRGEGDPAEAAWQAEQEAVRVAGRNAEGQPVLDLVLLGMGEDGHVASLFPGEPDEVARSQAVYRPVRVVKAPPQRITIGYRALAAARCVWVLVSGPGKGEALKKSLSVDSVTPLGRVVCSRCNTLIFSDIQPV